MKVSLKGFILEKFTKQAKGNEGEKTYCLRIHQSGEKNNLDVKVSQATYEKAKENTIIDFPILSVGAYVFNNQVGMYAKEIF